MPHTKKTSWGFDVNELDPTIRPQDDFFHYVNKKWMENNPIPETESRWGSFIMLRYDVEKKLRDIVEGLQEQRGIKQGSSEQLVRDFYRSGMDIKLRNKLGTTPLKPWQKMISGIHDTKSLLACIASLHVIGIDVPWGYAIDQDIKDNDHYILQLGQSGLGMPDRDYYLKDDAESKRLRDAYRLHMKNIFRLIGKKPKDAEKCVETVMAIETRLAQVSMTKEDLREPEKTYHKYTISQLEKHSPEIHWSDYFKRTGVRKIESVIMGEPAFFKEVEAMLNSVPLDDWKIYLEWHVAADFSSLLSEAFRRENFSYAQALVGLKKMRPMWRQVLAMVNGSLDEVLGQVFVKKYFTKDAKKKMNDLVDDLFVAYEKRIKGLDWMTPATKKKALGKLRTMVRKIGYPDRWKNYSGLVIKPHDYVGNAVRVTEYEHRRQLRKLGKPVDRREWFMSPQTVNAYCNPAMNEIVFPAAILQPPFFSLDADDALNYGCIGAVIGHEMTHNFDDQGSKFDAKGNLKSWWTEKDRKQFEAKAKRIKDQYDGYRVADGVPVNGQLTLGENIADLGGVSIAFDAFTQYLKRTKNSETKDGFTPEQRFFIGFSLFERESARPEFEKMAAITDPHSPAIFRINGTLTNLPEFYEAFGLKKGDKLYKENRNIGKVW